MTGLITLFEGLTKESGQYHTKRHHQRVCSATYGGLDIMPGGLSLSARMQMSFKRHIGSA